MSVANLVIDDASVRVVTDTCTYVDKQPVGWARKVNVNSGARLAVAVRGRHWIGVGFREMATQWTSFDEAVEQIDIVIPKIEAIAAARGAECGPFEVTLAGWDDGPRALRVIRKQGVTDRFDLSSGVYLAPSLGTQNWPERISDDQLGKIALVQQTLSRRHGLLMCVSGDVELATVDQHGARVDVLESYPDKDFMSHRILEAPLDLQHQAAA